MEDCDLSSESLACVAICNRANPILRRNKINNSNGCGVLVYDSGQGLLEENIITGNKLSGVEIRKQANPKIINNVIAKGKGSGIVIVDEGRGEILHNDIYNNASSGIKIKTGGNPIIKFNKIHHGKQRGVVVYDDGLGLIQENEISSFKTSTYGEQLLSENEPQIIISIVNNAKQVEDLIMNYFNSFIQDSTILIIILFNIFIFK